MRLQVVLRVLFRAGAVGWMAKEHVQVSIELTSKGMRNPKTLQGHWRQNNRPGEVATDTSLWKTPGEPETESIAKLLCQ